MTDAALNERDDRGNWRPAEPIALAPINAWPPRPVAVVKWLFGFPGYIWPYHLFWLGVTLVTWAYLTPDLATMVDRLRNAIVEKDRYRVVMETMLRLFQEALEPKNETERAQELAR